MMWIRGIVGISGAMLTRRLLPGVSVAARSIASHVVDRLRQGWSPEQIAGHLRLESRDIGTVCHETIYQFVYGPKGRKLGRSVLLPRQRKAHRRRFARNPSRHSIGVMMGIEQDLPPSPSSQAKHHVRPWDRVLRVPGAQDEAGRHQLFLQATDTLAERKRGEQQWTRTPLLAARYRHHDPDGRRSGCCYPADEQHAPQVPELPNAS